MADIEYEYAVLELVPGEGWSVVTGRPFVTLESARRFEQYLKDQQEAGAPGRKLEVRKRAVGGWESLDD